MIKQCNEVALFQKMMKIKSDIDNLKSVDVTSLPSATYNNFSTTTKVTLVLLYVADGKLVTSTDFKLSMSDLIFKDKCYFCCCREIVWKFNLPVSSFICISK
jgi:hypothetical protein